MKFPFISLLLLLSYTVASAQVSEVLDTKRHKVVIQFNDSAAVSQLRVIQQVDEIRTSWPNAVIEVVCVNDGLDLLITSNSKEIKAIDDWVSKGVVFSACNATMRRRNIRRSDLLQNAHVIPSGQITISVKQEQGWAYFMGGE